MKLIYTAITSLDGYIEDLSGNFDWSMPDAEVHQFVNDLERRAGTYLLGRKMYEVMMAWETMPTEGEPPEIRDYKELWLGAEKVVYSRTLPEVSSARTRIERSFDVERVKSLIDSASSNVSIGGPELAAHAFKAGLVDEVALFVSPIAVGGGKPALPPGLSLPLRLIDERRFANGVVYLRYEVEG